jgi:hypothetical protein
MDVSQRQLGVCLAIQFRQNPQALGQRYNWREKQIGLRGELKL